MFLLMTNLLVTSIPIYGHKISNDLYHCITIASIFLYLYESSMCVFDISVFAINFKIKPRMMC